MSDDLTALTLAPDETVQWSAHPRLLLVLPDAVLGASLFAIGIGSIGAPDALGTVLPGWIVQWLIVLVPIGCLLPLWTYLAVTNTRFVITDQALYSKRGVVGKRVIHVSFDRVQNSSYSQGLRGTIFGHGAVAIETAGNAAVIRFHDIENPQAVRARIDRYAATDDSIPGTSAQWEEILSEVRTLRSALESP